MVYVPVAISYRAALTPERLEQGYYYKHTVRHVYPLSLNSDLTGFLHAMKSSTFAPSIRKGDVRWGLRFYGEKNALAFSMYASRTGAIIAGKSYMVEGDIKKWLTDFVKRRFE